MYLEFLDRFLYVLDYYCVLSNSLMNIQCANRNDIVSDEFLLHLIENKLSITTK